MEDDRSDEVKILASRIGTNWLISKQIQAHLPRHDLFQCRLVNRQWSELAVATLDKTAHFIRFRLNHLTCAYKSRHGTLSDFTECFKHSKSPYFSPPISFVDGHLQTKCIWEFLCVHGPKVRSLGLKIGLSKLDKEYKEKLSTFENLFLHGAPNIRRLSLAPFNDDTYDNIIDGIPEMEFFIKSPSNPSEEERSSPKVILPSLEYLNVGPFVGRETFRSILDSAVNLKKIEGHLSSKFIQDVCTAGKLHTLKRLRLSLKDNDVTELLENWSLNNNSPLRGFQLKLESIQFDLDVLWDEDQENMDKVTLIINKILEQSQNTLKRLDNFEHICHLPKIRFPILPHVKIIQLDTGMAGNPRLTSHHHKFPDIFPNVEEFLINQRRFDPDETLSILAPDLNSPLHVFPSVRTLEIHYLEFPSCFPTFKIICPNTKRLKMGIGDALSLPGIASFVWEAWPGLENIYLAMIVNRVEDNFGMSLDAAFTGLSEEEVRTHFLREDRDQPLRSPTEGELEQLVSRPAISNLKHLKSFSIGFRLPDPNDCHGILLSEVTGVYAFDVLRQRQPFEVTIMTMRSTRSGDAIVDGDPWLSEEKLLGRIKPYANSFKRCG